MTPRPSKPGTPTSGRWPLRRTEAAISSCAAETDAGKVARTGIDPCDLRHLFEHRHRARVERRREAVEDAVEAVVGANVDPERGELEQHLLLRRVAPRPPGALLRLGRVAHLRELLRDRRRREHDDHPRPGRDGRARRTDEAAPARRRTVASVVPPPPATLRSRRTRPRSRPARGRRAYAVGRASSERYSGYGTGSVNLAADAIIAALSVHSGSGARAASGSAARSSEFAATPPTTATRVGARRLDSLDERADDRTLIARRQVRAARGELVRRSAPARHRAARSSAPRTRSRGRGPARPGSRTPPDRPRAQAGRARDRRGSRARAGEHPCRTPPPPRRPALSRGRGSRRARARRGASCGRRSRAGR